MMELTLGAEMDLSLLVIGEGSSPEDLGLFMLFVGGNWKVSSKFKSSITLLGLLPPQRARSSLANMLTKNVN